MVKHLASGRRGPGSKSLLNEHVPSICNSGHLTSPSLNFPPVTWVMKCPLPRDKRWDWAFSLVPGTQ